MPEGRENAEMALPMRAEEWEIILRGLSQLPYGQSAPIIHRIQEEWNARQNQEEKEDEQ
jgi:hypothetical protein